MRSTSCVASNLDDEVDLNAGPKRQRGHPDRRAGRKGLTKILCVDAIHRDEVTHAREKHTDAHDIIETLAGRLENRREILEDAVRLGRNSSRAQLALRRLFANLTAEIDETAGVNGLGKRAHRRREFRRGNCGLAHGKLLCTVGSLNNSLSGSCRIFSSLDPQEHKLLTLYDGEPTIPPLHYYHDDIDYYARLRYSLGRS